MRFLPQRRPAAQNSHPLGSTLAALAVAAPVLAQALSFNPEPSPNLDFSNLGKIVIAGEFNGISLYEYEGQTVRPPPTNGSLSLLTELPNGVLSRLAGSDAIIRTMCPLKLSNGDQAVVVAGNFTTIGGIKSTAMALFNTNTAQFSPLDGLEGEVSAILCDQASSTVYVGGNFKAKNSTNAIAWRVDDGWATLPFAGFNAPVSAITKTADDHIVFGGSFTGLGNLSSPTEPDGQVINLSTALITTANGATTAGFDDPSSIVCSDGSDGPGKTWLVRDGSPGIWEAQFDFGFEPTRLRLWNTHLDGRGTKTFRFITLPDDGILNFTYVDPATGKNESCTNLCPLSGDPSVEFQDFQFVNTIGMSHFQISISDWYGAGAGLAGIQLLEDNIFTYAVEGFNEPKCGGISFPSTANLTGSWTLTPAIDTDSDYLTANLAAPITPKSASVVFTPNIRQSGNYSINMYTPGCVADRSCSTRGQVRVTGLMSNGTIKANFTTSFHQTNYFDKYDQIYFGYIDASSEMFKPTVTMTPLEGQDLEQLTMVAQKIGFTLINGTGGLNGLFAYDPSNPVIDMAKLDDFPVNKLGSSLDHGSAVTALETDGDVTYIGGHFITGNSSNLIALDGNGTEVLSGGLNDQVLGMHLEGTQLFVGGKFTNRQPGSQDGLEHVAMYDTKARLWSALGAGVDGQVDFVTPFQVNISHKVEAAIAFSGPFSQCNAFGNFAAVPADGFAIWVLSEQNWLANLDASAPSYTGSLTSSLFNVLGKNSLYAGSLSSAELSANGVVALTSKGLSQFPAKIQGQVQKVSGTQGRAIAAQSLAPGVATGAFYTEDNNNLTVLAGHFSAQTDGPAINNLLLIDGKNNDALSGLGNGMSVNSSFTTIAFHGSVLYAGGNIDGNIDGADVNGIIAFDVVSRSFKAHQPAPVSGGSSTVSAITVRPGTSEVYVGGSFARAGALDCPGVCLYDEPSLQWTRPGNSLGGSAKALMWYSKTQLIAGGDLQANASETTYLAIYDAKTRSWTNFAGADKLPGPVDVLTPASSDNSKFWVSGTASSGDRSIFMMRYDGKQWQNVERLPPTGSVIESLQVFTTTKPHGKTDLLADNQVLMLTGSILLPSIGRVSAVLYNGTDYRPYALATGNNDGAGSISRIFTQHDNFFASEAKHLPVVFVVLIGLAISLVLILLLVISGIALDRVRKRREGYMPAPTSMYDRGSGLQRIPPRELLEELGKSRASGGSAPQI